MARNLGHLNSHTCDCVTTELPVVETNDNYNPNPTLNAGFQFYQINVENSYE